MPRRGLPTVSLSPPPGPFFLPGFAASAPRPAGTRGVWRGWDRCSRGNGSRGLTAPAHPPRCGAALEPPAGQLCGLRAGGGRPQPRAFLPWPRGGGAALGGWPKAGGGLGPRGGVRAGRSPPPPIAKVPAGALCVAPDAIRSPE